MNLSTLICASSLVATPLLAGALENLPEHGRIAGGPVVEWHAPSMIIAGQPYRVHLDISAPEGGTVVANWMFGASAFTVDGNQLGKREDGGTLNLPAGFHVAGDIDLAPFLKPTAGFKLGYASDVAESQGIDVALLEVAPAGLDFMDATKIPDAELAKYAVELRTNRGDILLKLWPDVAPNHVRNFLDLSYKKPDGKGGTRPAFYDATTFHRVIAGYMIQGGDPGGTGAGDGPRMLKAELSAKHHVRGVISMARGESLDSASCQFFIMHGTVTGLDGQYTAFGETVSGMDAVDKIANAPGKPIPGAGGTKPDEVQAITEAIVFRIAGN